MSGERGRIVRPLFVLIAWTCVLVAYLALVAFVLYAIATAPA